MIMEMNCLNELYGELRLNKKREVRLSLGRGGEEPWEGRGHIVPSSATENEG